MDSTRDEENEYSSIDYSCLAVDRESTNSTSRSQLRNSEGNTYEEPSSAVKKREQKVFEPGETLPLVNEEEGKKQNSQESICFIKCEFLILFILLTSALSLLFCLHYLEVMLLGGRHNYLTNSTTIYNSMEKSWKNCKLTLPSTFASHGAVILNNEIYIFGGHDNETTLEPLKFLYKLGAGNKWERMADMTEERTSISQSSVIFNSEIWVIGGWNGKDDLKSVEKYNPKTKKWIKMPELNESRINAAATVIDGKIYVSGGWNGSKSMNSVEVYDPEKRTWELFTPSLPYAVDLHILIENHSHLIVIGGDLSDQKQDPTNRVLKMNVLDSKREWKEMASLQQKLVHSGAAMIADELMVFGGFTNDTNIIDSVEIFVGDKWKNGTNLSVKRGHFAYIPLTCAQERLILKRFCQNS